MLTFVKKCPYSDRMETFGERLRRLREDLGISKGEFARRVGKSTAYISLIEANKRLVDSTPPTHEAMRWAEVLNVSLEQLVGDVPLPEPKKRPLTDDELFDKIGAGYVEDIPFIEDVMASAGPGSGIPQDIDDTLPKSRRRRYFKHLRSLMVTGRCLEPDLCPGDLIHIDRDQEPTPGRVVVVVRDEEEALIKRLTEREGEWFLTANDGRPEIPVDEHIRILGPVVAYQRHLL